MKYLGIELQGFIITQDILINSIEFPLLHIFIKTIKAIIREHH